MSDFVRHNAVATDFATSDSWVILSPIEQSIKRKIEAVGTPLKDWDIQINYGIKTGYNEAFIITTEKREEILSKCADEDERKRTDELIRPILRGRDIRRYGYDWANLWLINTHNGIKGKLDRIHIEDYPAVKAHLDQYWDKISTRADKGDTPYNLRNCAYLDDFNEPKLIWGEISDRSKFAYDSNGSYVPEATTFLLVGEEVISLYYFLNS
ncbi:TaqI-like C-terminal specificity domain-containing protein, partial [Bacteroides acidifaciens]|uniref:TaqI-like C-terminal specificity domain-containing protein n=1 Tax=Bacteroides acidifaciens TaxID=85831 RepID=UPI0025A965B5